MQSRFAQLLLAAVLGGVIALGLAGVVLRWSSTPPAYVAVTRAALQTEQAEFRLSFTSEAATYTPEEHTALPMMTRTPAPTLTPEP